MTSVTPAESFGTCSYGGPGFVPMFPDGMFRWKISAPVVVPASRLPHLNTRSFISSSSERFQIEGDFISLRAIIEDMRENAGELEPIGHWHVHNAGNNDGDVSDVEQTSNRIVYSIDPDEFAAKYATLAQMLDPLVGRNGMRSVTPQDVEAYERYLRAVDHCQLLESDLLSQAQGGRWLQTDLGSIMDVNLILGFALLPTEQQVRIVEVGGGYGRLAEVLINVLCGRCHYVMVDSVPATMMFAYRYLRLVLPTAKIGSYYEGDAYSSDWTVYIMPSWHMHKLESRSFHAAINIESFQEMRKFHVNFYVNNMTRLLGEGQILYLSNSWQYLYREGYDVPSNFKTIILQNTPRSWTAVHPTHAMRKGTEDYSIVNSAMLEYFRVTSG